MLRSRWKQSGLGLMLLAGVIFLVFIIQKQPPIRRGNVKDTYQIQSTDYSSWYEKEVRPFMAKAETFILQRENGVKITYRHIRPANNLDTVYVLAPGYTEPGVKYAELAYDLHQRGYGVIIVDHRGQGDSTKLQLESDAGYVTHFKSYVDDLHAVINQVKSNYSYTSYVGVGISMGGAVLSMAVMKDKHLFDRIALVAPMFKINTGVYPSTIAYMIAWFNIQIGRETKYVIGRGPWNSDSNRFKNNSHPDRSYQGWKWSYDNPKYRVGGPSYLWFWEAMKATDFLRSHSEQLTIKMTILGAGRDTVVETSVLDDFCSRALDCTLKVYEDSRHDILSEADTIRSDALNEILSD